MSEVIKEYLATPSSARLESPAQVRRWFESLLSQGLSGLGSVSDSIRSKLTKAILTDLASASGTREGDYLLNIRREVKWDSQTRLPALQVLKELSRLPGGSAPLGSDQALRTLLLQVDFPKHAIHRTDSRDQSSLTSDQDPDHQPQQHQQHQRTKLSTLASTLRQAVRRRARSNHKLKHGQSASEHSSVYSRDENPLANDPDWTVTDVALRCLNNALFLNESARIPFSSEDIGGGHIAVALLSHPQDTPADILFLGARLLFFSTLFESPFNKTAVEVLHVVHQEAHCVEVLVKAALEKQRNPNASSNLLVSTGSVAQFTTALSDLLKAHFNICLYYPRIIEAQSKQASSSSAPPSSITDHSNTNAKGNAKPNGNSNTPKTSNTNGQARDKEAILGEAFHPELVEMLQPLLLLLIALPIPSPVPLMPPFTHAVAALLNYPIDEIKHCFDTLRQRHGHNHPNSRSSSQSTPARPSTAPFGSAAGHEVHHQDEFFGELAAKEEGKMLHDVSASSVSALRKAPAWLARLIRFADLMLDRYFSAATSNDGSTAHLPEDVDAKVVQSSAKKDGIDLEDSLQPLLLLLRKVAAEDLELRSVLRDILLPKDLDRGKAADKRIDLLGRLVRLMSSVTLSRLARASGELLLAICDSEPATMTQQIGYGPCAGFLMNQGLASALPSQAPPSSDEGRTINPITGEYDPTEEELAMDEINRMTEEEKEAEAEKLFVLFDRLNKTGVMSVRHPMQAAQEGDENAQRFQEITNQAELDQIAQQKTQEEQDEKDVEREMQMLRKRKQEAKFRAQNLMPKETTPRGQNSEH